jgi:DNA mismatch repair protein MutS2
MKVLKNGSYEVSLGNVSMVLKKDQLEVIDKIPDSKQPKIKIEKTKVISSAKMSLSLDLRGERYEDAKDKLQKYFDDAILTGLKQFTIIHGYGTGTIRNLVQDYLRKNKNVQSFRYGGAGEGGMGSTVVILK